MLSWRRQMHALFRIMVILFVAAGPVACGGSSGGDNGGNPPITPTNSAPVALDVSAKTNENDPLIAALDAQDSNGDQLTYSLTDLPAKGTVEITDASTGSFRYTPNNGAFGPDIFKYRANDGAANSNEAAVTITINRIPVAQGMSLQVATTQAKTSGLGAIDQDGDSLVYEIVLPPANGSIENFDATTGHFTYQANASYVGDDSFSFRVTDGFAESAPETVSLTVDEWVGTVNLGTLAEELAIYGLEIDEQGNLYVAHSTTGAIPGSQTQGGVDTVLSKLDRSGSILWQRQWGTTGDEVPYQIARDSSGNIYATIIPDYSTPVPGTAPEYLVKFDSNGDFQWSLQIPESLNTNLLYRMTISPDQHIYITALGQAQGRRAYLLKVSPSGAPQWVKRLGTDADDPADPLLTGQYDYYDVFAQGVAVDGNNTVYVALSLSYEEAGSGILTTSAMLAILDSNGRIQSRIEPFATTAFPESAGPADISDIRVLPNGNLRVSGNTSESVVVAEVDSAGVEIWSAAHSVPGEYRSGFRGNVSTDGSSIVTGLLVSQYMSPTDQDVVIHKFSSSGVLIWDRILSTMSPDGLTAVRDDGGQPILDADGDIYMSITSDGGSFAPEANLGGTDIFVVKIDGLTGEIIESR
jgi:hypothetical protein